MVLGFLGIFGSLLDFIVNNILSLAGGMGTVFMAVIIYLTKKYLAPYLMVESRRTYARYIASIADDLTDDLITRYPSNKYLGYIDEAVDKIIEICNIDEEIARRAVSAAFARK